MFFFFLLLLLFKYTNIHRDIDTYIIKSYKIQYECDPSLLSGESLI